MVTTRFAWGGNFRVMGNHQHGNTLVIEFLKKLHYLGAGLAVQSSGRLIRQKKPGVVHDRPGNRNSLHLSSGKLIRLKNPYGLQALPWPGLFAARSFRSFGNMGIIQRHFYIGKRRLSGKEMKALKYKSDFFSRISDISFSVHFSHLRHPEKNSPFVVWSLQTADDIHQRGFS